MRSRTEHGKQLIVSRTYKRHNLMNEPWAKVGYIRMEEQQQDRGIVRPGLPRCVAGDGSITGLK